MQTAAKAIAIEIRQARADDLQAVESLLTAASLPTLGVAEHLADFMVATASDAVVGVVGMEYCGNYGLMRSTAVDPDWRGKGIAGRLVEHIVAAAEARGIHALYLLTTTAERYFPSYGFSIISRDDAPAPIRATQEYCGACPSSATMMSRTLQRYNDARRSDPVAPAQPTGTDGPISWPGLDQTSK